MMEFFIGDECAERVRAERIRWLRHREDILELQKVCGAARDREGARFFKEEASYALKCYRAACLLLPYVDANLPGDCIYREPKDFPIELAPMIRQILGVATS